MMSTVVSVAASFAINAWTFSISGCSPTRNGNPVVARCGTVDRSGTPPENGGWGGGPPTPATPLAPSPTLTPALAIASTGTRDPDEPIIGKCLRQSAISPDPECTGAGGRE